MSRWRIAFVVGLIAIATVTLLLLSNGKSNTAAATPSSPYAAYQALNSNEPSGLPLVAAHDQSTSSDPTWPIEAPEGAGVEWPLASSIRKVSPGVQGISVWIAKSIAGGICVLLYDGSPVNGVSAVAAVCSTPENVDRGATVEVSEVPGQPGKVYAAGVVPDDVTSVQSKMADGSTYTAPVTDNSWARVTDVPAQSGQTPTQTIGG
jgi:hypothetical protein